MIETTDAPVSRPGRKAGAGRRFSRRTTTIAASLSLLAAGVGGGLVNAAAPAQAADPTARYIAVVIPWNRIAQVQSFKVKYTPGWDPVPFLWRGEECFEDVEFTDAMNYWSTPYTTKELAADPHKNPLAVQYFESTDCTAGEIANVKYVDTDLYFGNKYVYTYKAF